MPDVCAPNVVELVFAPTVPFVERPVEPTVPVALPVDPTVPDATLPIVLFVEDVAEPVKRESFTAGLPAGSILPAVPGFVPVLPTVELRLTDEEPVPVLPPALVERSPVRLMEAEDEPVPVLPPAFVLRLVPAEPLVPLPPEEDDPLLEPSA